MSVSTVDAAAIVQPHARRRFHHQVVAEGRRHAHADQPASLASLAGHARLRLFQPKRPAPVRRHSMSWRWENGRLAAGALGFLLGLRICEGVCGISGTTWVSLMNAELDRIEPELLRHLVDGDLQRHHARRLAGRAHRIAFRQIEHRKPRRRQTVCAGIEQPRLLDRGLRACRPGRSPDQLSWPIAVILPSLVAPMRMRWIVAGRCVVLLNMQGRAAPPYRTSGRPRPERREQRIGTNEQLSAKAAANEWRDDADILLRDAERPRHVARRSSRPSGLTSIASAFRRPRRRSRRAAPSSHAPDRAWCRSHRVAPAPRRKRRRNHRRRYQPDRRLAGLGAFAVSFAAARSNAPLARTYIRRAQLSAAARACSNVSATTTAIAW